MRHTSGVAWTRLVSAAGVLAAAAVSHGQSINIRFGPVASTPAPTYGAAGLPGTWNSFLVTPDYGVEPLVSLQNTPIAAQFYQYGSSSMLSFNNPLTSGDDKKLMDNMILSTNNPTDGCFWVQNLMLGQYEVTMYAMTPNDPTYMVRTRVDGGSPGPTMVGGTWPGHQQAGITYARFTVTTTDGVIAFHDGLAGAVIQSGMNGVQLKFLGNCSTPTFSGQPSSATVCQSGHATFNVAASSATALGYQWQIETAPGTWTGLTAGPLPLPCGGTATATAPTGSQTDVSITPCAGVSTYQLRCLVSNACGSIASNEATYAVCYANCDCSATPPTLNVSDFTCFLQKYAAGDGYANCDNSTAPPTLNVGDFTCFLQRYAAGCP